MKRTRYLLLGAGRMAMGAVDYLLRHDRGATVHLVDLHRENIRRVLDRLPRGRGRRSVTWSIGDLGDSRAMTRLMDGAVVALSGAHYRFNPALTKIAIRTGCHMVDLGGNNTVVRAQLRLGPKAREAGVTVIPDCGLAPGMTNLLAVWGASGLDPALSIAIRVGGVPLRPVPPLNYMLVFSPEGLINEYIEDARAIRDRRAATIPSLDEVERLRFPPPFGTMEAFNTSGGSSTLVETMRGRVRELDYKTIRYPGHAAIMQGFRQAGLMRSDPVRIGTSLTVVPRRVLGALLEKHLPLRGEDAVLVRVTVEGKRGGRRVRRVITLVDRYDRRTGLTAMMRCTAFPAACIASMLAGGVITRRGVFPQETVVPPRKFVAAMRRAGLALTLTSRTLTSPG